MQVCQLNLQLVQVEFDEVGLILNILHACFRVRKAVFGRLTEFIETQGRFRNFDLGFPVIILIGLSGFFTDQILALLRGVIFPYTEEGAAASTNPIIKAAMFVPRWFREAVEARLPPDLPQRKNQPNEA